MEYLDLDQNLTKEEVLMKKTDARGRKGVVGI